MNGEKNQTKTIKKLYKRKNRSIRIEELINRVNPEKVKCGDCEKWVERKKRNQAPNKKWYCQKCLPKLKKK